MKIKHYDKYGNEFIKFDIIPNLKHLVNSPSITGAIKKKLRFLYDQKHTCSICGKKAYYIGYYKQKGTNTLQIDLYTKEGIPLNIDHIIPVSKGGSDLIENKQCACITCNSKKGNTLPDGTLIQVKDGKFIPYKP